MLITIRKKVRKEVFRRAQWDKPVKCWTCHTLYGDDAVFITAENVNICIECVLDIQAMEVINIPGKRKRCITCNILHGEPEDDCRKCTEQAEIRREISKAEYQIVDGIAVDNEGDTVADPEAEL